MSLKEKLIVNWEEVCPKIEAFIREKMEELKREGVILGLSGGIDSAVVANLCERAVGKEKVLALIMPERDSAPETVEDAKIVAEKLGIKYKIEDLTSKLKTFNIYKGFPAEPFPRKWKGGIVRKLYDFYRKKTGRSPFYGSLLGTKNTEYQTYLNKANAYYRIKHRLRMVILYWEAELRNLLYVSCANRTEWLTGFFVKFGCDGAGDIMPILPFYKTQVRELGKYLNVPKKIREKAPSPDIIPGITDEYALGISYEKLDLILVGLEQKMKLSEIAKEVGVDERTVEYVKELNKRSEHMREVYKFPL